MNERGRRLIDRGMKSPRVLACDVSSDVAKAWLTKCCQQNILTQDLLHRSACLDSNDKTIVTVLPVDAPWRQSILLGIIKRFLEGLHVQPVRL